jgi:outer membrane protein assembly factor BamB
MSRRWSVGLFVALLSLSPQVFAADAGWPQWRGPHRDGKSAEKGINTDWEAQQPELLWQAEGLGGGYASVAIAGDKLFTTGNFDDGQAVVCLDLKNQQIAWKTPVTDAPPKHGYEGSRTTPSLDGDRLYVVSSDGEIACLKQQDGKLVWKRNFKDWKGQMSSGWGFSESPLVDGDWVLCTPGGKEGMIVALDKMTGKEIWKTTMPELGPKGKDGAAYSSIVVSNGGGVKQYVQLVGRGVIGVRASDGEYLWGYNPVANGVASIPTPIPSGDYVFCSSGYGDGGTGLVKLSKDGDGVKAEEVYFHPPKEFQNHHGGMVLVDGKIYCGHGHNNGFPACLDLESGNVLWGTKTRGEGSGSAAVLYIDGHLIFRYQSGKVVLIEATPDGYKIKGSFDPAFKDKDSWAHPVVVDKKLYLREQDKLMCYDLAK